MGKRVPLTAVAILLNLPIFGQTDLSVPPDSMKAQSLDSITVKTRRTGIRRVSGAENGIVISREELFKAACCNLGESFTTNPSVDVNYSDAATGAKQIRLLGLSGTYVQMLTENLPNFRGAASPYALDYVPGPWMKSILVSKGSSSVRNGYESITGQIDVEYLKPDDDQGATFNLYGNTMGRMEANADANVHIGRGLSTEILAHYQDDYGHHDQNDDGFIDQPNVQQFSMQNRWKWQGNRYLFHGGVGLINEKRDGGQTEHTTAHLSAVPSHLFKIGLETDRYDGYMKHAFVIDPDHGTNIALMGNLSMHQTKALYGHKRYSVNEKNAYAQLMFETNLAERHNMSAGLSINHDYFGQRLAGTDAVARNERETTPGAYMQYTYNHSGRVIAMAGLRIDHSS